MFHNELADTIAALVQPSRGILAADESTGTIGKRFAAIGVENSEQNRSDYRALLAKTQGLGDFISGVILFEETLQHVDETGKSLVDCFAEQGIIPGIKVDKGLINLPNTDEKITQGLDGLEERLQQFKQQGARFAKWRNVYSISEYQPSLTAVRAGAEVLARYAALCQSVGIVPIVEPEVLIDGDHDIESCADACEIVLHELFTALYLHQVMLEFVILKPSMVTSGKSHAPFSTPEMVAEYSLSVFKNTVPAAVPSINFLSGGQSPSDACANLNAMNQMGRQPWRLSFSFGRALQETCLNAWGGKKENIAKAQAALLDSAKKASLASDGKASQ